MAIIIHYMAKSNKATRRVGRPSRRDLGLAPKKYVAAELEAEVVAEIYKNFTSIGEALRFAARHGGGKAA